MLVVVLREFLYIFFLGGGWVADREMFGADGLG